MRPRRQAALLAAAALVASACRAGAAARAGAPEDEIWIQPEEVEHGEAEIVEAREGEIAQAVAAPGRVAFEDRRVQHVLSPVAGRVTRELARPGQRVRKGAGLVALLSPDVGSAFSDLLKAQADLAQARAELARQRRLAAAEAGPRRDLEAADDVHRKAEAELSRARQKAALLRSGDVDAVTQELTLRSAIDGEVLTRSVSPGMEIQAAGEEGCAAARHPLAGRGQRLRRRPQGPGRAGRGGARARSGAARWSWARTGRTGRFPSSTASCRANGSSRPAGSSWRDSCNPSSPGRAP